MKTMEKRTNVLVQLTRAELKALKADIKHGTTGRVSAEAGIHPTMVSKMLAGNYTKEGACLVDTRLLTAAKKVKALVEQENQQTKEQYL